MSHMTPEQYQEMIKRFDTVDGRFESIDQRFENIDRRFDGVESRIAGVEKHLRVELMLKTASLWRDFKDELRSVKEELLDAMGKNEAFTSDVNDRLSGRINRVAAFVDMPTNMLLGDENKPDETA